MGEWASLRGTCKLWWVWIPRLQWGGSCPFGFGGIFKDSIKARHWSKESRNSSRKAINRGTTKSWVKSSLLPSWDELTIAFNARFLPPSRMMKVRDKIQSFERLEGEPIDETWLRFKNSYFNARLTDCQTMCCFNTFIEVLIWWIKGLLINSFEVASFIFHDMVKINHGMCRESNSGQYGFQRGDPTTTPQSIFLLIVIKKN